MNHDAAKYITACNCCFILKVKERLRNEEKVQIKSLFTISLRSCPAEKTGPLAFSIITLRLSGTVNRSFSNCCNITRERAFLKVIQLNYKGKIHAIITKTHPSNIQRFFSARQFYHAPTIQVLSKNKKNIQVFLVIFFLIFTT